MSSPPASPTAPVAPCDFYDARGFEPLNSMGFLMRRVIASILQQADMQLAEHGLTYAQWLPLYKLMLRGRATNAEMARALGLDPASVTRALDRLEAKGLLRRARSSADRRVVHVVLTGAGRAVAAKVPQVLARVLNAHLAGFARHECDLLLSMLQRMLANGDALRAASKPDAPVDLDLS